MEEFDVIVVGAGLSGLWTTYLLAIERKLKVKLLEARDRVGGRTKAVEVPPVVLNEFNIPLNEAPLVDVGGQWVGPQQVRINHLIKKLNLATVSQYYEWGNFLHFFYVR